MNQDRSTMDKAELEALSLKSRQAHERFSAICTEKDASVERYGRARSEMTEAMRRHHEACGF